MLAYPWRYCSAVPTVFVKLNHNPTSGMKLNSSSVANPNLSLLDRSSFNIQSDACCLLRSLTLDKHRTLILREPLQLEMPHIPSWYTIMYNRKSTAPTVGIMFSGRVTR